MQRQISTRLQRLKRMQ